MIREVGEQEFESCIRLSEYAFQYQLSDQEKEKTINRMRKQLILADFEDAIMQAKLHIYDFTIVMNQQIWRMGGVASVATWPEYRRGGKVKNLLLHALERMRAQKQVISFLHPFQIDFYRRYGWELFASRKEITVPQHELIPIQTAVNVEGNIRRLNMPNALKPIQEVYEKFSKQHNGMLNRTREWWEYGVLDKDTLAVGYYNAVGELNGYLLYKMSGRKMIVEEMVTIETAAKIGLWQFICQHDSMLSEVTLTLTECDELPFMLVNPRVNTKIEPYFMARIVDMETFVAQYQFEWDDQPLFIHVDDPFAKWNKGSIFIKQGEATFYPAKMEKACVNRPQKGLHMDIGAITTLLMGHQTAATLYRMGRIEGEIEEVKRLDHMVSRYPTCFYDFF
ncbi:GNAT family N-acetyltransferase [Hazenella sp. IB182357]|uniref:GNAT family N-acetyltransferase n=1 Tax=Polycladospora coralii TaxID=2771432 RepID=A0A926N9Y0_9BACL|nr:GNAT family N-acetyltransferase [Polycladospora coralii]MBD1371680.1 GNAT family N-acetyltransferase [Polycladospora coralii]MBS7529147.1 GNAT family N-acetyltransferase [Polycladospora coralii]